MKFAKLLQRAVVATHRIAPELWMDYKGLKKLLLALGAPAAAPEAAAAAAQGVEARVAGLAACPSSCAFFSQVMRELSKVAVYYSEAEAALVVQYEACLAKLKDFLVRSRAGSGGGSSGSSSSSSSSSGSSSSAAAASSEAGGQLLGSLLSTCLYLTSELIQLENYAVLCYAGFGKILKKHDKVTGASGGAAPFARAARCAEGPPAAHSSPRPPPPPPRRSWRRQGHAHALSQGARQPPGLCHRPHPAAHDCGRGASVQAHHGDALAGRHAAPGH